MVYCFRLYAGKALKEEASRGPDPAGKPKEADGGTKDAKAMAMDAKAVRALSPQRLVKVVPVAVLNIYLCPYFCPVKQQSLSDCFGSGRCRVT